MTAAQQYLPLFKDIIAYLRDPRRILLPAPRATELLRQCEELTAKIKSADDTIVIGLVGGTGVGKSTLINALAGQRISASTDLRPTTNHLVLYRHRNNPFSLSEAEEIHVHESEALRSISLVDFPDFDSIEPHHRQALAEHFPSLDLLLWVVDPVKYADEAFFHWLGLSPQARGNSLFVFNKLDEFERRYGDRSEEVAAEVIDDFTVKLNKFAFIKNPEILAFSALSAWYGEDGAGQPGFIRLKDRLLELKDRKRRLSIKTLNLSAMVRTLLEELDQAAEIQQAQTGLEKMSVALGQGERDLKILVQAEAQRLGSVLRRSWVKALSAAARDNSPQPIDFFLFIWDRLTGIFSRGLKQADYELPLPQPDLTGLLRRLTSWLEEMKTVFGAGQPAPALVLVDRLSRGLEPQTTAESGSAALLAAGLKVKEKLKRSFRWRLRHHLLPFLVLLYPFLPLIFTWIYPLVTGETASAPLVSLDMSWRDLWPLLQVVAGLYVIETIYFAYRLNRETTRALEGLIQEWEKQLQTMLDTDWLEPVRKFNNDLEKEIQGLEAILARRPVDEP